MLCCLLWRLHISEHLFTKTECGIFSINKILRCMFIISSNSTQTKHKTTSAFSASVLRRITFLTKSRCYTKANVVLTDFVSWVLSTSLNETLRLKEHLVELWADLCAHDAVEQEIDGVVHEGYEVHEVSDRRYTLV